MAEDISNTAPGIEAPRLGASLGRRFALLRESAGALRRKIAIALVATALAAASIAMAHGWRVEGLWEHFAAFSVGSVALALAADMLQLLSQAGRLWAVSSAVTHARWPAALRAFAFGQVANLYLPARLGDAVKAGLLGRAAGAGEAPVAFGRAAGAVFVADKLLDAMTVALIVAASAARSVVRVPSLPTLSGHVLIFGLVLVATLAAALRSWRPRWWAALGSLARGLVQGAVALANPRSVLAGLSFSMAAWSAEGLALRVLAHAGGQALSFQQCLWVLVLLNVGIAVPVSLANVGTFEASVVLATTSMGVPPMEALALATVHHAVQLIATCALALALWIPMRRSRRAARGTAPSIPA